MNEIKLRGQNACPSCKNQSIQFIDTIPPIPIKLVQGQGSETFLLKSSFYRCSNCSLYFRSPQLDEEVLEALYTDEQADYLHHQRKDWSLIAEFLGRQTATKTIIDIGCFDGGFLDYLKSTDKEWQLFGVEINKSAAKTAEGKGTRIVSRDFNELDKLSRQFGVITAIDILEHSHNPRRLIEQMLKITLPGGLVIISTGNTEAFTSRLMKGSYWYYAFPGAISFINEKWARRISNEFKAPIVYLKRFSHGDSKHVFKSLVDGFKNISYKISPQLFGWLREIGLGDIDVQQSPELKYTPPNWRSAKDHLLIVFKKSK